MYKRQLQPVLRVDREGGTIWLGNPDAQRVSRPLGPEDGARLRDALAALHAEGLVHGHVDASHLRELPDGSLMLRFSPNQGPTGTIDNDRIALARLLTGT